MRKQKGVTLSGFLLWAIVVVFVVIMGFKVAPAYFENMSIQTQMKNVVNDRSKSLTTRRDIETAFDSRATIENITAIKASDLEIAKDGDQLVISANYTVCVPLIANMRACMDFAPSSAK